MVGGAGGDGIEDCEEDDDCSVTAAPPLLLSSDQPSGTAGYPGEGLRQGEAVLQASVQQEPPRWLSNASFSENLIPEPLPIPEWYAEWYARELGEHTEFEHGLSGSIGNYSGVYDTDLLLSSSDRERPEGKEAGKKGERGSSKRRERKRKKEKVLEDEWRKHQKNKKEKIQKADEKLVGALEGMHMKRKSDVRVWADSEIKIPKDYYFDTHGDRDNLAFGSLYRMDIARYHHHPINWVETCNYRKLNRHIPSVGNVEEDGVLLDEKVKSEGRYWSAKYASLERRKDFKRLRIIPRPLKYRGKLLSVPSSDFIAIDEPEVPVKQDEIKQSVEEEECWDDYVIRKTREFNRLTRERPHDESLWIAFANFQDELVHVASKKAVVRQVIEKKIAVLERALELHPSSENLLLLYLETCKKRDDIPILLSKWEKSIMCYSSSYKLWREFLHLCRGDFSLFKVSFVRKQYVHGIRALSAARIRSHLEDDAREKTGFVNQDKIDSERTLVTIFVDLCRFEWQTGHHELAIGLFQAQIEYNLFAPPIRLSENRKQRLFQDFWDSGAPRIGEGGAVGWAAWLEKEEQQILKAVELKTGDEKQEEEEPGGWTGWSVPLSRVDPENLEYSSAGEELDVVEEKEEIGTEEAHQDDDENTLLERLGLSFDAGREVEVKDAVTWKRWSEEEERRDCEQWFPVRSKVEKAVHEGEQMIEEDDEELERAVLFEDIRECLFSLNTEDARFDLIGQFADFCCRPFPLWCCSNSFIWKEKIESLENVGGPLLKEVENVDSAVVDSQTYIRNSFLWKLVGGQDWLHECQGRAKFVRNVLLMCRYLYPHSLWLQEKLLSVEVQETGEQAADLQVAAPRAFGKKLLKAHRQDIVLWTAYARIEAAAGNMELARKVFDTTLTSLSALPVEVQAYAPILYLAYAEAELSQRCSGINSTELSRQKVLHILGSLGAGDYYSAIPVDYKVSGTQLLKARRGFKDQLKKLRMQSIGADVNETLMALVACAALFEQVADGWEAAASIFEESLAMSLPGKRQHSLHFELLFLRYVAMLEQHKQSLKPAYLRHIILQGLAQYPNNPQFLSAYMRCRSHSTLAHDLRRFFDEVSLRNPSTVLWLFALSCELGRSGAGPRIHSLFERALENRETQQSVVLWRCYLAYELQVACNSDAARRVFFRAIHACPWSKTLWLDGFKKMSSILSAKELSEFQDIMRDKELRLRTDVYEILLEEEELEGST